MGHLDGRVAIVTGAGRGIGAAIAAGLASEGATVVVNDLGVSLDGHDPSSGPAQQVAAEIIAAGGTGRTDNSDVTDHAAVGAMVAETVDTYGRLDIVVNVAGILRDRMLFNMAEQEWDPVITTHMKGTFNTTRHAAEHWRAHPGGPYRLINITSTAGLFGAPGMANYSAAKMGIIGFTLSCAGSLGQYGVVATGLMPRAATRMTDSMPDDKAAAVGVASSGAERAPANVADAAAYLAGDGVEWANGRVFGAGGERLTLYSNHRVEREIVTQGRWDVDAVFERLPGLFRPAVEHRGFFDDMTS
jgi:NAD(P)-dependent dehydrogenase (short-subunit alcohol dehydrogenase family)